MLEIWGRKTSSNVQALMWCVGELQLKHVRHDIGHRFGGTDTLEFAALNPNRTVPVLRDKGGPSLWETGAILRYLAGRYAPEEFWPNTPAARADVDRWAEWAKLNVAMNFTVPIFWRVVRTPRQDHDQKTIREAVSKLESQFDIAETQLARHPYLAGDDLTLADIQFGHILFRYYDIDIGRRSLPHLQSYYRRLTKRRAYREHVMIPYGELRPN